MQPPSPRKLGLTFNNGWIFSPTKDLLAFGLPIVFGGALTLLFDNYRTQTSYLGSMFDFEHTFGLGIALHWVLTVFLDVPHAMSTAIRIGFDTEDLKRRIWLYIGVPVGAFLLIGISATYSFLYAFRIIAYLNIIHSIRQEYGWIMYSRKKAGETDSLEFHLDRIMIYSLTLLPVLFLHCQKRPDAQWLFKNDLFNLFPERLGTPIMVIYWTLISVYLIFLLYRIYAGKTLNLSKLLIMGLNWMAWYFGLVIFHGTTWMLDIMHATTYLVLIAHYGHSKWGAETNSFRGYLFKNRKFLFFYSPLVAFTILKSYLPSKEDPWIFSLMILPAVAHYVLDGFLWKTGKSNPSLTTVLRLSKNQEALES
jgi:hypothetical protein